jgi:hypothetical protein
VPRVPLARLVDPDAVASIEGPRARLRIEVPASFLVAGAAIELTAPARLVCAGCDGGGCDGCSRSGAHRAPEDAPARTLRTTLPGGAAGPFALRIPEPFGQASVIRLLLVEVRIGPAPSACVRQVAELVAAPELAPRSRPRRPPRKRREPPRAAPRRRLPWPAIAAVVLAAGAILAALLHR